MSEYEFPKFHDPKPAGSATFVVWLSLFLVVVSAPHAAEDFSYGAFARFGIGALAAGLALGLVYGAQAFGSYLAGRGSRFGSAILGLAGAVWCIGALAIHGREILASGDYRHGVISRALEVTVIVLGAVTAVFGFSKRVR